VASRAKLVFTGNEGVSSRLSSTGCLWCLGRLVFTYRLTWQGAPPAEIPQLYTAGRIVDDRH
jgi:hypothetical protein